MGFKNACTALYLVKNYLLRAIAVYHIQELASYKTRANKKVDTNYKNSRTSQAKQERSYHKCFQHCFNGFILWDLSRIYIHSS